MKDIRQQLLCISDIGEYLDTLAIIKKDVTIALAVKDTPGSNMSFDVKEKLRNLGFNSFSNELWKMYAGIINYGDTVVDYISKNVEEQIEITMQVSNIAFNLLSASWRNGNIASVVIDGLDYACNVRGINIVVYDIRNNMPLDSICYDSHDERDRFFRDKEIVEKRKWFNNEQKYDVELFGCWCSSNYGSILNGYSTYKIFKSINKSVLMIKKPGAATEDSELYGDNHGVRFYKKYYNKDELSPRLSRRELGILNKKSNYFCTGSDQIWNYNISFGGNMFLPFVDSNRARISFATSCGSLNDNVPIDKFENVKKELKKYNSISVRDEFSKKLLNEKYGVDAEILMEPVFCVEKNVFDELINNSSFDVKEKYIVAFILDPSDSKLEILDFISKKLNSIVITIPDGKYGVVEKSWTRYDNYPNVQQDMDVEDFLKVFSKASFIVTDSFHGTCFSLIFEKKFVSLCNQKRGAERFTDILGRVGLLNRLVTNVDSFKWKEDYSVEIDYKRINEIIKKERKKSVEWLKDALDTPIKNNTVEQAVDMIMCTGCGACANSCPKNAIAMIEDKEGFLKPQINKELCINCGVCVRKCINISPKYKNEDTPACYAMMADDETRKISSSGGMFTVAANYILDKGGYVCGAAYKDDFSVEHIIIDNKADLYKLRGSKYMQSHINNIYVDVKRLLEDDKYVLFTGMPCQNAGLYSYLGGDYEKLYTIDLLCHGITSSKVFSKYHKDVLAGKQLSRLEFKEKEPWGWHAGINAYFTDGLRYQEPLESDPYFIAYLNSLSKNNTCGSCKFNKLPRQGDLTIGDFWGISRVDSEMYDGKGTSIVLVNNEKAQLFFDEFKSGMFKVKSERLDQAIPGNRIITGPYGLHKNRKLFFENLENLSFQDLTEGCFHNHLYDYQKKILTKLVPERIHNLYYFAKTVVEKSHGRKIVIWLHAPLFEKVLKDYFGVTVDFAVTKDPKKVNSNTFLISKIEKLNNEYYVVSVDPEYSEDLYNTLNLLGYKEVEDFLFRKHKPIVLENYDCSKVQYTDLYGNTIEGYSGTIGRIVIRGCNNHIFIGKDNVKLENLKLDVTDNVTVRIGSNNRFNAPLQIETRGYEGESTVNITNGVRFTDGLIRLFNNPHGSSVTINERCSFETDLEIHSNSGKHITIGKDCMFSHDVDLWAGDGHTIFDVESGQNINSDYENLPEYKNQMIIGEHVWVSKGAFIMHGTVIGNGSVVGAKSVVKGKFPNNCSIAGNPAQVIKKNIAWSREMIANDMFRQCGGEEYVKKTEETSVVTDSYDLVDEPMDKTVLILGGTGRMSTVLTNMCLEKGYDVTIATRGKHSTKKIRANVKRLVFDRNNEKAVKEILKGRSFDIVFDCSGYVPQSVDWVLSTLKIGRYIYISSIATYVEYSCGLDKKEVDLDVNLTEYEPQITVGERAWYGRGKYNSELLIASKYSNMSYAIVRIPFVMSKVEIDYDDNSSSRVMEYVKRVINEESICEKNIDSRFSFVDNSDEVGFLMFLAESNHKGVFNFAAQGSISMREVISYVEEKTGKKAVYVNEAEPLPFTNHPELTINVDKCISTGYIPNNLEDWIYNKIDKYIDFIINT